MAREGETDAVVHLPLDHLAHGVELLGPGDVVRSVSAAVAAWMSKPDRGQMRGPGQVDGAPDGD
jgi:hypothetical protein